MRAGIDIGGTFTDLVAETDDGVVVVKVPSTPSDPSVAFATAISRLARSPDEVLHGTTVGTNAVLTRSGARLGFIGTKGFRHLLHLARQDRPSLYDMSARRTPPLVERDMCIGVRERIGPRGEVIEELDEESAKREIEKLRGVEGVAVTFLHAYANPSHESRVAELVGETLGDVAVSISSDVLPEFREYERASTTALNAYVQPVLSEYLRRVDAASSSARIGVMWSGGGVRGITRTIDQPVHTLYSGPAAGVLAAAWIAERCGFTNVVTLDMGGTSADVALVEDGRPGVAEESALDGLPFRTPTIDVISVGAGGGSIAWIDEGGALRVGPMSAGAEPGPACYGRGGTQATVTDAQCLLGYLGDDALAGGELELDVGAAHSAVGRLARDARLDVPAAGEGVLRVVRATMARAVRSVSIERGRDVRRHALVAFGGAGPLHATALASELGIEAVIVPPSPGALAALGLLVATRRADASLSRPGRAERSRDVELRTILTDLTNEVIGELHEEGVSPADIRISLEVDCRYEGQSHELRVPVEGGPTFVFIAEAFHEAHKKRYGFSRPNLPVEAITFRATALGPQRDVPVASPSGAGIEPSRTRKVGGVDVPAFERWSLPVRSELEGPALVTEIDSTTWIDAGWTATVHESGALLLR